MGEPAIAGSAQVAAVHGLGEGAFDAGAHRVALLPRVGLLLGPALVRDLVDVPVLERVSLRRGPRVQESLTWREPQSVFGNCTRISTWSRTGSLAQRVLVFPPGQATVRRSQSMLNAPTVKVSEDPARFCQPVPGIIGPVSSTL